MNLKLCQKHSTTDRGGRDGVMAPFSNNSPHFETRSHAALEKILCFMSKRAIKTTFLMLAFPVLTNAVLRLPVVQ